MKKTLLTSSFALAFVSAVHADVVFSQDFTAGGTTATYVSATPNSGQWNAISTSGAAKVWSINSNTLNLASTGANAAYSSRTTDFATTPTATQVTFTFNLASSSTALTSSFQMSLGNAFTTGNSTDSNASVYAKFGLNFTASNGFLVRDISGSTNGASTFGTGAMTLTWVTNNSGSTITYLAPDGSNETIANDKWDLWVGTSKQLDERTVTTALQTITDFKFGAEGTGSYAFSMDNIVVADLVAVPEPSTYAMLISGLGLMAWVARRRLAVA